MLDFSFDYARVAAKRSHRGRGCAPHVFLPTGPPGSIHYWPGYKDPRPQPRSTEAPSPSVKRGALPSFAADTFLVSPGGSDSGPPCSKRPSKSLRGSWGRSVDALSHARSLKGLCYLSCSSRPTLLRFRWKARELRLLVYIYIYTAQRIGPTTGRRPNQRQPDTRTHTQPAPTTGHRPPRTPPTHGPARTHVRVSGRRPNGRPRQNKCILWYLL